MQCFYAARLEREHPRCAIQIYIRLTNGLVSNNEYSSGDDHVTDFSEPADNVMTVPVVLLIALRTGLLIQPSVISPERCMSSTLQFIDGV